MSLCLFERPLSSDLRVTSYAYSFSRCLCCSITRVISWDIISAISSPMFDFSMSRNDNFSKLYHIKIRTIRQKFWLINERSLFNLTYSFDDDLDLVGIKCRQLVHFIYIKNIQIVYVISISCHPYFPLSDTLQEDLHIISLKPLDNFWVIWS